MNLLVHRQGIIICFFPLESYKQSPICRKLNMIDFIVNTIVRLLISLSISIQIGY